jgi:hypothetical protein
LITEREWLKPTTWRQRLSSFYERPILNSPYRVPELHHPLDKNGQPLEGEPTKGRRPSRLIVPVPASRKKALAAQSSLELETCTEHALINEIRGYVDRWRALRNPADWGVTGVTQRLLDHWRNHQFAGPTPFFCQLEAVETTIWLTAIGLLCDIPFGTLYGLFARWTRLGLWRRMLDRLRRTWRRAWGDAPEPSAVMIDSRSCCSAPSCFARGIDGGKKVHGVKIQMALEKYGSPLAIDVAPANRHDTKAIVPVLRERVMAVSKIQPLATSARQAAGRGRSGTRHHRRGHCARPRLAVHSRRHLLGG